MKTSFTEVCRSEEVTGGWRRLNNEELHNVYISPKIIRFIISRRMRWVTDIAHMGKMRKA
jgi:hypothetical protein